MWNVHFVISGVADQIFFKMMYCRFGNFREGFNFAKLRNCENSRKIKSSRNGEIILPFTDIGESCPSRDFLTSQMSFNAIRENRILAKISEFIVLLSLKIVLILANSADSDELLPYAPFHLDLHCLTKYLFTSIQNEKG